MSGERLLVGVPRRICGTPTLDANEARWVIMEKTQMLFGDAKQVLGKVVNELFKTPAKEVALR